MKAQFHKTLTGLAFCLPWIAGLSIFTLYPVAASLYYSFCDYSVLQPAIWTGEKITSASRMTNSFGFH